MRKSFEREREWEIESAASAYPNQPNKQNETKIWKEKKRKKNGKKNEHSNRIESKLKSANGQTFWSALRTSCQQKSALPAEKSVVFVSFVKLHGASKKNIWKEIRISNSMFVHLVIWRREIERVEKGVQI